MILDFNKSSIPNLKKLFQMLLQLGKLFKWIHNLFRCFRTFFGKFKRAARSNKLHNGLRRLCWVTSDVSKLLDINDNFNEKQLEVQIWSYLINLKSDLKK